jgi:hypothetical protein
MFQDVDKVLIAELLGIVYGRGYPMINFIDPIDPRKERSVAKWRFSH